MIQDENRNFSEKKHLIFRTTSFAGLFQDFPELCTLNMQFLCTKSANLPSKYKMDFWKSTIF